MSPPYSKFVFRWTILIKVTNGESFEQGHSNAKHVDTLRHNFVIKCMHSVIIKHGNLAFSFGINEECSIATHRSNAQMTP